MFGPSVSMGIGGISVALFGSSPDENATADGVSAVAWLDAASTDHVKNTIFQYVYNESLGGRWQHIKLMYVPRTNLASAYTCIKTGNTATATTTLTHTTGGVNIPAGESVDLNYDLSGDFNNISDFCFGTAIESLTSTNGNNNAIVLSGLDGSIGVLSIGWQSNFSYWSANLGGATSSQSTDASQLANGYNTIFRVDAALNGSSVLTSRNRYKDQTGAGAWASVPTYFADSLTQNPDQVNGELAQVWAMTYVAHSDLDWETFRDNTNTMLDVLTQTAPAFSAPINDGDSLEMNIDNSPQASYYGWVSALTTVPTSTIASNSSGGKSLRDIAATAVTSPKRSLDLAIAANPNADSLIIGAGINDITNVGISGWPQDGIAVLEGYVDEIFDQFAAASNLKHIMIRQVAPSAGRYSALPVNDPTNQQGTRWQPFTDQLNVYIAGKVTAANTANPGSAFLVENYAATESSVPAYANYQEGIINSSPQTTTGGTTGDGDLTVEGVHWKQSGADIVAALGDIQVSNARYFKILDPYYKGGRPS